MSLVDMIYLIRIWCHLDSVPTHDLISSLKVSWNIIHTYDSNTFILHIYILHDMQEVYKMIY